MKKLILLGLILNLTNLMQAEEKIAPKEETYTPYNPTYYGYYGGIPDPLSITSARLSVLSSSIFREELDANRMMSNMDTNYHLSNFLIADASKDYPREEFNKIKALFTDSESKSVIPRRLDEIAQRIRDLNAMEYSSENRKKIEELLSEAKGLYLKAEIIIKNKENEKLIQDSLIKQVAALPETQSISNSGMMGYHMGPGIAGSMGGGMGRGYSYPYSGNSLGEGAGIDLQREAERVREMQKYAEQLQRNQKALEAEMRTQQLNELMRDSRAN